MTQDICKQAVCQPMAFPDPLMLRVNDFACFSECCSDVFPRCLRWSIRSVCFTNSPIAPGPVSFVCIKLSNCQQG